MKWLGMEVVKMEKMFVEGLGGDRRMIGGIMMVGERVKLEMIGEGVESEGEGEWVGKGGVGIGEGLVFGGGVGIEMLEES